MRLTGCPKRVVSGSWRYDNSVLGSGTFTRLEHSLGFGDINNVFAH